MMIQDRIGQCLRHCGRQKKAPGMGAVLMVVAVGLLMACSSVDCPLNNSVYTYYGLYKADGTADTLRDTLSIITTRRMPDQDPVLINQDVGVSRLTVAISYEHPQDEFIFLMHGGRSITDTLVVDGDTTVTVTNYIIEKLDTVTVRKQDMIHFESVDCNPSFFHTIEGVEYTRNFIDSIVIINPTVDYDAQTEHFRLYLRSLD